MGTPTAPLIRAVLDTNVLVWALLLALAEYGGIPIGSPAAFLEFLQRERKAGK